MIEAVVACVDEGAQAPPELSLEWQVQRYNTLPLAGGLYDQEYSLLNKMRTLGNIYDALTRLRSMKGDEIHKMPPGMRRIIGFLRRNQYI